MIDYELYCRIKQAEAAGHSAPQIARSLQLHVQTVRRWQAQEKYVRSQAAQVPRASKLDVHKPAIARWLETHPFTAMQLWKKVRERGEWEKVVAPKKKTHLNDVMHAVGMGLFLVERGRV